LERNLSGFQLFDNLVPTIPWFIIAFSEVL
jgi:hypothetical protein